MLHKDVAAMDRGGLIFNILIFMLLWVYGGDYRRGHSMEEHDHKENDQIDRLV